MAAGRSGRRRSVWVTDSSTLIFISFLPSRETRLSFLACPFLLLLRLLHPCRFDLTPQRPRQANAQFLYVALLFCFFFFSVPIAERVAHSTLHFVFFSFCFPLSSSSFPGPRYGARLSFPFPLPPFLLLVARISSSASLDGEERRRRRRLPGCPLRSGRRLLSPVPRCSSILLPLCAFFFPSFLFCRCRRRGRQTFSSAWDSAVLCMVILFVFHASLRFVLAVCLWSPC